MAVTIIRPYLSTLPTYDEKLFGAASPNYIQWTGTGGTITTGELEVDGIGVIFSGLYPNQDGIFSFDLSILGRVALSSESIHNSEVAEVAFIDESLFVSFSVTLKVKYSSGSPEELQNTLLFFINAYRQRKNLKKSSFYEEGVTSVTVGTDTAESRALLPTDTCPVFAGYPNDVSIFHFEFTTSTDDFILLRASGVDIVGDTFTIPEDYQGVISVNLNDLANYPAINIITSESGGETRLNRNIILKHYDYCGVFVSWLNSYGGWSYWLFEGKPVDTSATERGQLVQRFTADPFIEETFSELSKEKEERFTVASRLYESWQIQHLKDLELSNQVYLYTLPKNEVEIGNDLSSWQRVKVRAFDLSPKKESNTKTIRVELSLGKQYTP